MKLLDFSPKNFNFFQREQCLVQTAFFHNIFGWQVNMKMWRWEKKKEHEKKTIWTVRLVTMEIGMMIAMEWKPMLFYTLLSIPPPRRQKNAHFSCMEQRIVREKKCNLWKFLCSKWNVRHWVCAHEHLKKTLFESWTQKNPYNAQCIERSQRKKWYARKRVAEQFMQKTNIEYRRAKQSSYSASSYIFFFVFCLFSRNILFKQKKIVWKNIKTWSPYLLLLETTTKVFWLACTLL